MPLTTLNIGRVPRDERRDTAPSGSNCPQCDAPATRRIDAGGFGRTTLTVCGYCGHEFTEGA